MKFFMIFCSIIMLINSLIIFNGLTIVADDHLHIYILNVGQGDALLIKTPNGNWGMIDSGKNTIVLEELEKTLPFFIRHLSFIVLTHPDADHIEGFIEILKRYEIKTVFTNKTAKQSRLFDNIVQQLASNNIDQYELAEMNDFIFDNVYFDIIWPIKPTDYLKIEDSNDTSISMIISYGKFEFYTAGDLSFTQENQAISFARDIDIMKVSHHGSATSTNPALLKKLTPEIAIISAGKNNSYGHPHKNILTNLQNESIHVMRTDETGMVEIKTDGTLLSITGRDTIVLD